MSTSLQETLRPLSRSELPSDTVALARLLIGRLLVRELAEGRIVGRIVETEAYVPGDASSHAYRGPSARNGSMFLRRGHAYVYLIYGMYRCLNVSSEEEGVGAAVLLRALEPLGGVALMERRRGTTRLHDLARGPGRLAQAMEIDLRHDGLDLCKRGELWLADAPCPGGEIGASVRIGITKEADRVLRFYERGNAFVSGPRRLNV